jgi:chromosome segregation ATPase
MNKKTVSKKISIKDVDVIYNTLRDKVAQDEDMIEQLNNKLKHALARINNFETQVSNLKSQNQKLRGTLEILGTMSKTTIDLVDALEDEEEYEEEDEEEDDDEEDDDDEIVKPKKSIKNEYITMMDSDDDEEDVIKSTVKTTIKIESNKVKRVPKITIVDDFDNFLYKK